MSESKRFEDWIPVDCNECSRYWDSSCDGVKCDVNSDKALQGSTRLCNSFLPTRSIVIPAQIKRLEERVRALELQSAFLWFIVVCYTINDLIRYFGG